MEITSINPQPRQQCIRTIDISFQELLLLRAFKFCKAEVQGSEASRALQALDKLLAWSLECVALVRKRRRIFGTTSHQ